MDLLPPPDTDSAEHKKNPTKQVSKRIPEAMVRFRHVGDIP